MTFRHFLFKTELFATVCLTAPATADFFKKTLKNHQKKKRIP